MSADYGNGSAPGGREHHSNGWSVLPIDRLFDLPAAIELPGYHREIEQLVTQGHHAEAATAIAGLAPRSRVDRERVSRAQAICLMRAGDPRRADLVLRSATRTAATAWFRACSLVRLGCFVDAADEVVWTGERVPLLGNRRRAARALLGMLGRPLPTWLVDPVRDGALSAAPRSSPPPYLASFFYPTRPAVPPAFEDAAIAVQRGRYDEAARLLIDSHPPSSRVARQLAIRIAECWLLADEPEAAEAWLHHRPTADGAWALLCARVHQDRLDEALSQLVGLARRHALRRERREAAAALLSHLDVRSLPEGLEQLRGHPFLDPRRAQEAGYRRFADKVVREVRQGEPGAVELVVKRVEAQCDGLPVEAARSVLLPMYEAAVRVWSAPDLAERGLGLVLARPELLGSDEAAHSRALLFATTCERLPRLRAELHALAGLVEDDATRFACWMASAKASLVLGDLAGIKRDAAYARRAAASDADRNRARRMRRAAHWLAPEDGPRISQWQLRPLHHLLPLAVAGRVEDRDSTFQAELEECAAASATARRSVDAAGRQLRAASRLGEAPDGHPRVRKAVGFWALHVGRAFLETDRALDALPFTGAAWRLLHPELSDEVVATHGRAIGAACRALEERGAVLASLDAILRQTPPSIAGAHLVAQAALEAWEDARRTSGGRNGVRPEQLPRLLAPASPHRPVPPLAEAAPALGDVATIPAADRVTLEQCFVDRWALLPDAAPFRGRQWFASDTAHRQYQRGRQELDTRAAYKAFEEAWLIEPNSRPATQGLILGWGRRLAEKPGRRHVLEHLARILDQIKGREVEAALAYTTLAAHADIHGGRRAALERAAAALERRVRRQPWTRARNAEIAIRLELGDVVGAGDAAWTESQLFLPGSEDSRRYALLAAALWERARDSGRLLGESVREARQHAVHPELTNREAVEYAATTGRLVALTDLTLDEDALEDLWLACRGDEDDLCRFLEKQGMRPVDPRPHYLRFLARKLVAVDPAAAARIDSLLAQQRPPDPPGIAWLRLAAAELIALDPLEEVATPQKHLAEVRLRECMAVLRQCARHDEVAYSTFATAVKDALAALFDVREADPSSAPEPYGERLAKASEALQDVRWAGRRLGSPAVAAVAELLFRYLALALDSRVIAAYQLQKERRLVASRIGSRLGSWWADVSEASGPLDFFHYHQSYRYAGDVSPDEWLRTHHVHGKPVREAVALLLETLERHGRRLAAIEDGFRSARPRPGPVRDAFSLQAELQACCAVLRGALQPCPGAEQLGAMETALERLGRALRRIDLARLVDLPHLLYDNALPTGQYVLPRATELLDHLRRNVRSDGCLQAICEVADDSGREVSCVLTLDGDAGPAPESTPLRGLDPFSDLVQALGGQFHLWMARPGEQSACRLQHDDGLVCLADDYVPRIEERLRRLTRARWRSQRHAVEPWLGVLDAALSARGSVNLAFVLLPRMHE